MASRKRCRVLVELRPDILDPAGQAVQRALKRLGFDEVADVRIGKVVALDLDDDGKRDLDARVREMADQLLRNPIVEDVRVEWPA